jgi:hypothetical protein
MAGGKIFHPGLDPHPRGTTLLDHIQERRKAGRLQTKDLILNDHSRFHRAVVLESYELHL